MIESTDIVVRPVKLDELDKIFKFLGEIGLIKLLDLENQKLKWRKIWEENPLLDVKNSSPIIGWILEHQKECVGFFGHILRLQRHEGKDILVSIASTWAVSKDFRSYTKLLSESYFSQKDIDLLVVTTGIKPVSRIFESFGGKPMPQSSYDEVLFWVLNIKSFIHSGLLKKEIDGILVKSLAFVAGYLLAAVSRFGFKNKKLGTVSNSVTVDRISPELIGSDFDELWLKNISKSNCLYSFRKSQDIKWVINICSISREVYLLGCREGGELVGYILISIEEVSDLQLKRAKIIDLFVLENSAEYVENLFAAAYEVAKEKKCQMIELIGLPQEIRNMALKYRPFSRKYPSFPYSYKVNSENLELPLQNENCWYPTAYDGDTCF
jgi:hypothetical protein